MVICGGRAMLGGGKRDARECCACSVTMRIMLAGPDERLYCPPCWSEMNALAEALTRVLPIPGLTTGERRAWVRHR
jgi:hypothetical protein